MTFRLRSRKLVAATGILAVIGVGGGVAYAYPPGTDMTVSATASQAEGGVSDITVTVFDVNPTCSTTISIDGTDRAVLPPGESSIVIEDVPATAGRHRVRARNTGCASGDKEKARGDFTIPTDGVITPPSGTIRADKNAKFTISGLAPIDAVVTVSATKSGGGAPFDTDTDTVDRRGNAKVKFKFPEAGTYILSATIDGPVVATLTVTVS